MKTIVYCEKGRLHALELIPKASSFSETIIALCEDADASAAAMQAGAQSAVIIGCAEDDCAQGDHAANTIRQIGADSVLFPATVRGRFLSAWVAARLETGLTADCTALDVTEDGLLLQSRPAFGGNLTADILCKTHRPQMASVRPGVFPMPDLSNAPAPSGTVTECLPDVLKSYCKRTGFTPAENTVSLQEADVIIAGGKGIGSKKGFEKLFTLARLLGGAVGATRQAVDAGYISYPHQIGQTGVTVRPKLYIGFGIAGIVQHTAGMNRAKTVIAVNTDRLAPIFAHADYAIVGDWETICDQMIAMLK